MKLKTSWKTTTIGIIIAVCNTLIPILQGGSFDIKNVLISVGIAIYGVVSKDFDVSGQAQ